MSGYGYMESASEYGGYGAESGYGKMTIDCNSALGLLGLLGLIELLRDIIEQITEPAKRRKRSSDSPPSMMETIPGVLLPLLEEVMDGPSRMMGTIPGVLLPLLEGLVDVNDGFESEECLGRTLCDANQVLMKEAESGNSVDGVVSGLVASLMSQVTAKAFTDHQQARYELAVSAGEAGRNGTDCQLLFPSCSRTFPSTPMNLWNHQDTIYSNT